MAVSALIMTIIITIVAFIISALPLYIAVKLIGGKTSIIKTILVNLGAGVLVILVDYIFNKWASLIAFILVIWFYREAFRLKWLKAVLAWILQFVFIFVLGLIATIFGWTLVGVNSLI